MRNSNVGCLGLIALLFVIGLVWNAILYVGMPIGLIGGLAAIYAYRNASEVDKGGTDYKLKLLIVGAAFAVLFVASAAGNFFTNDGPFSGRGSEAEQQARTPAATSESRKADADFDRDVAELDRKRRRFEEAVPECEMYQNDDFAFQQCMESRGVSKADMEELHDAFGK